MFHNQVKDTSVAVWVLQAKVQDTLIKAEQKGSSRNCAVLASLVGYWRSSYLEKVVQSGSAVLKFTLYP